MKKNKGAISIFALLSMMFFLIFVMVAYNNVAQKGKMQVETEGVLFNYYKPTQTATEIVASRTSTTDVKVSVAGDKTKYLKSGKPQEFVATGNVNKYVYSNGKIYKIAN